MRTLDLDQYWPTPHTMPERKGGVTATGSDIARAASSDDGAPALQPGLVPDQTQHTAAETRGSWRSNFAARIIVSADRCRRSLRGFDASAAGWASLGFVTGMVAWHAIGFWGFVHTAVLNGGSRVSETAFGHASINTQPRVTFKEVLTTGSLATFSPELSACVALVADRSSGTTQAQPCTSDIAPMRDAGKRRKTARLEGVETRLQKPEAWNTSTQESDTASAAPAEAPLAEKDFDLTLTADQSAAKR